MNSSKLLSSKNYRFAKGERGISMSAGSCGRAHEGGSRHLSGGKYWDQGSQSQESPEGGRSATLGDLVRKAAAWYKTVPALSVK